MIQEFIAWSLVGSNQYCINEGHQILFLCHFLAMQRVHKIQLMHLLLGRFSFSINWCQLSFYESVNPWKYFLYFLRNNHGWPWDQIVIYRIACCLYDFMFCLLLQFLCLNNCFVLFSEINFISRVHGLSCRSD